MPLTPKALDTLIVLVENPGLILEKEEMIKKLWPDSFVEEGNLTVNISAVRKALGERPNLHQYVVTIPGRGYRFVADVKIRHEDVELIAEESTRSHIVIEYERDEEDAALEKPALSRNAPAPELRQATSKKNWILFGWKRKVFALSSLFIILLFIAGLMVKAFKGDGHKAIASIAVLPLTLDDDSSDMQYISEGITESITNNLSQLSGLKVMSSASALKFKGQNIVSSEVGRDLNVGAVLVGRVTQREDNIVVNLELVDTEDNHQLWGEQFLRRRSNIIDLQRDIAREVSERLRLKLTQRDQDVVRKRYTNDAVAYELYLKGRFYTNKLTKEDLLKSIEYYNEAISRDSQYAQAYAALAQSYIILSTNELSPQAMIPKARLYATKAIELDGSIAEAHYALATINYGYDWNWSMAETELKRALELNPNLAGAYNTYSHLLKTLGRMEEAVARTKQALELDPFSLLIISNAGYTYILDRQYDQGIKILQRLLELEPDSAYPCQALGWAYTIIGEYDKAQDWLNKAKAISKDDPTTLVSTAFLCAVSGKTREAQRMLNEINKISKQKYVDPVQVASVYSALNKKNEAFLWLDKAYETRSSYILLINIDPGFKSLRSDPRFQKILNEIGNV